MKFQKSFNPCSWKEFNQGCALGILIGVIIAGFIILALLFGTSIKGNLIFDIIATILAIVAIIFIVCIFKEEKGENNARKYYHTKGYYWFPVTLVLVVLGILLGAVIYNPDRQTLPIERLEICNCEICFSKELRESGKLSCIIKEDVKRKNLEHSFSDYFTTWQTDTTLKSHFEEVFKIFEDYETLLKLCCSENAQQYIENLKKIKKDKIERPCCVIPQSVVFRMSSLPVLVTL